MRRKVFQKQLHILVSNQQHAGLMEIYDRRGLTVNELVRRAIDDFLEKEAIRGEERLKSQRSSG